MREIAIENDEGIQKAIPAILGIIKSAIIGGKVLVTIGRPKRNSLSNRKIHAIMGDIRAQASIELDGATIPLSCYKPPVVKAFLVRWFDLELKEMGEPLRKPGRRVACPLTGELMYVRPSTAEFTQEEACKFVPWLHAFGDERGVKWSDPALKVYEEYQR